MRRQNKKETKGEGKMTCYSGEQIRSGEEMLTASQTGSPLNKQTNKQRTVLFVVIYHMLGPYSEFLPHFPDFLKNLIQFSVQIK